MRPIARAQRLAASSRLRTVVAQTCVRKKKHVHKTVRTVRKTVRTVRKICASAQKESGGKSVRGYAVRGFSPHRGVRRCSAA